MTKIITRMNKVVHSNETILIILLALATFFLRLLTGPRIVDDAYITFRYAHNLATGSGFVFNPGERILATTTPLFSLILAVTHFYNQNLEAVAFTLAMAADVGTSILIFLIIRHITQQPAAATAGGLLFAVSAGSIRFTSGGMETAIFVFLITGACWLMLIDKYSPAGVLAALATLTRPEGVILLGIVFAVYIIRYRKIPWALVIVCAILLLPWLIFSTLYYGSPIPHSVIAKGSTYRFPPLQAVKSLLRYLTEFTIPMSFIELGNPLYYGYLFVVLVLGLFAARKTALISNHNLLSLWLFPVIYLGSYAVVNPPVWEWYALPLVPFTIIGVAIGGLEVIRWAARLPLPRKSVWIGVLVLFMALVVSGVVQMIDILEHDVRKGRELAYIEIVGDIGEIVSPGDTVASGEVGAIGYALPDARILDTQGLISPQAIPYRMKLLTGLKDPDFDTLWKASGSIPAELILAELPEFVITLDIFADQLMESEAFLASYNLKLKIPSKAYGSDYLLVYQRPRP